MPSSLVLSLPHGQDNPRNSEGAFVTLADGRILFAYTHYYGESWADHATARICGRYSSDGGRTWTDSDRTLVENEGQQNVMSVSLLRLQDGQIALGYVRKNSNTDCTFCLRNSSDEGETWSNTVHRIPAPGYFVVNNDRLIQLRSGRLLVPAAYHRAILREPNGPPAFDGRSIALCFLSDDGGQSWYESRDWWALPIRSNSGLQEPGVVELSDGRLYMYCRTDTGRHYELFSCDGGLTWSAPAPSVFLAPCSPLSIKRIPTTGDLLAVWNDHSRELAPIPFGIDAKRGWNRSPFVTAISHDEGRSWTNKRLLESTPDHGYCYTAIHFTEDAVLLGYCCGGGENSTSLQDLCVRRVTLDWLYGK